MDGCWWQWWCVAVVFGSVGCEYVKNTKNQLKTNQAVRNINKHYAAIHGREVKWKVDGFLVVVVIIVIGQIVKRQKHTQHICPTEGYLKVKLCCKMFQQTFL